ncbi:hypothetical protein JD844_025722 [Phrynosoma platyrhinos]|uniref:Uncharacterized protein n=1 Tax=Phrynosoma platyrhinos TaxID=52577 RepID=A0ABQ7T016_PHRPL|nr:hypothetical protein JD844_025722 [Phrynosoma platyrhinos]
MKFLCLLFAVAVFCRVQADDTGLDQEAKQELLQTLDQFQDDDQAVLAAYDDALEDFSGMHSFNSLTSFMCERGNVQLRSGFDKCRSLKGKCFFGFCPRATFTVGRCDFFYRCCK